MFTVYFFFFQAEDGIRDKLVTGVQTCALPISINGHTLFIETAEPREMALEVLDAVETQLDEADRLKKDAVEMLQANHLFQAMQRLSGCFTTSQHSQESIEKISQFLRIDLARGGIYGPPVSPVLCPFPA